MKDIKKLSFLLLFLIGAFTLTLSAQVKNQQEFADTEEPSDDQEFINQRQEYFDYYTSDNFKSDPIPCTTELVVKKIKQSGFIDLLKHSIYLHSNSILNRNLHDLPTFNWTCNDKDCLDLAILPFYNQTSKIFFTDSNPHIESYINLSGKDLIGKLDHITTTFMELSVEDVLPLFRHIKLQERRTGLFFRACSRQQNILLQFSVPLYYLERNFFLSNEERKRISDSDILNQFATNSSQEEAEEILTEHLVGDKFGLGDMRIYGLYTPYQCDYGRWSFGGFITLPTAVSFKEGIIGGTFCKTLRPPELNLKEIICSLLLEIDTPNLKTRQIRSLKMLENLAFGVLDHLTANIANTSLGNNGHVTIAPMVEYQCQFNDNFGIISQGSIQYVAPSKEERFFIKKINLKEFNRDFENSKNAESDLRFIERALIDNLFPKVFNVTVSPGAIFNFTTALLWQYGCTKASIGYDYWRQNKETIDLNNIPARSFLVERALNPFGEQHKLFGSVGVDLDHDAGIFRIGLRGDITVASHGIGRDFTLALDLRFIY